MTDFCDFVPEDPSCQAAPVDVQPELPEDKPVVDDADKDMDDMDMEEKTMMQKAMMPGNQAFLLRAQCCDR